MNKILVLLLIGILFVPFLIFETFSENIDELINEAKEQQKNGNNEKALEYFDEILKMDPENIKALYGEASIFLLKNNFYDAKLIFESILKIDPEHVPSLIGMGIILAEENEFDNATEFFDNALQLDSENTEALINKAVLLMKQKKDYEQIITLLDKVLDIEPNNIQALQNKKIALNELPTRSFDGLIQTTLRDKNNNLIGYLESDRIIITEYIPKTMFNKWISSNSAEISKETDKDILIFVRGIKEYTPGTPPMRTGESITWIQEHQNEIVETPIITGRQHGLFQQEGDVVDSTWQLVVPKDLITKK